MLRQPSVFDSTPRPRPASLADGPRLGHTTRKDAAAMHSAGNPLATLLLTAPLLVVPTLAALGLPAGGSPGGEEEDGFVLADAAPFGGDGVAGGGFDDDGFDDAAFEDAGFGDDFRIGDPAGAPGGAAPADRWAGGEPDRFAADPGGLFADSAVGTAAFADVPAEAPATVPVSLAAAFDTDADMPAAGTTPAPARTAELADGGAPRPLTETAAHAGPPAVGPADLPGLSRQLKALGATRLSLEPSAGAFYFGCTLVERAGGARIARRFEAEAPTAAAAVADVLGQVRTHRAARPAAADMAFAAP